LIFDCSKLISAECDECGDIDVVIGEIILEKYDKFSYSRRQRFVLISAIILVAV
jgi:hypothetical protein